MSSHVFGQVKMFRDELERLRKENETLKVMLEVIGSKCNILESHLQQSHHPPYNPDSSKRARIEEFPFTKSSKIFVKVDEEDKSLVSLLQWNHLAVSLIIQFRRVVVFSYCLGSERWISMAKIWTEGHKGQSVTSSLLSVLHGSGLPRQEEGINHVHLITSFLPICNGVCGIKFLHRCVLDLITRVPKLLINPIFSP